MTSSPKRLALLAALGAALAGCGEAPGDPSLTGTIGFDPKRPQLVEPGEVAPYKGSDPNVLEAQERFRTGLDLHLKVIARTCGPTGGVCHNQKEYPDLHTPANWLGAIEAPCNVQPGNEALAYDRCERPGDRFKVVGGGKDPLEVEIGWLEYVPGEWVDWRNEDTLPDGKAAGLHIYTADPLSLDRDEVYGAGQFIRTFVNADGLVEDLVFARFEARWWILDGGKHLFAEVREYHVDRVQELLSVGIVQGDLNRNGVFGARQGEPVPLISPGRPEESYLVARLRGTMLGEDIPGSRMPLANQPLTVAEMLALYCWIEGVGSSDDTPNLAAPIDYAGCSYSVSPEDLNLLGEGVTWKARVKKILEFNCGGCHTGDSAAAGLVLKGEGVYERLLGASVQNPDLNLVEPFDPDGSYLWLKLIGHESIVGQAMPYNPLTGVGKLKDAELNDIRTWIEAGAVEDQ